MKCVKCHKNVKRATILKLTGSDIIWNESFSVGYECGCFERWLKFIEKKSPSTKIIRLKEGARIYFKGGEDEAERIAREFIKGEVFVFR